MLDFLPDFVTFHIHVVSKSPPTGGDPLWVTWGHLLSLLYASDIDETSSMKKFDKSQTKVEKIKFYQNK